MNNKPVAWVVEVENDSEFSFNEEWAKQLAKRHKGNVIPLYTHPADLTDVDITRMFYSPLYRYEDGKLNYIEFARAILRKAQEK